MVLNYMIFYIYKLKTSFVLLPTTFQVQKTKEAFIEGEKEEEGMKEEGRRSLAKSESLDP